MDDAIAPEVDPLELVARELHEMRRARQSGLGLPVWEDLDLSDPWERGARTLAFDRARDFVALSQGAD